MARKADTGSPRAGSSRWPTTSRGGRTWRVCGPDWEDPGDTSYSQKYGGRWNAPGSFGVLYLNATQSVAAAQARAYFRASGFELDDVRESERPDLVEFTVQPLEVVDVVSDAGVASCGLPASYPYEVTHSVCQTIGAAIFATDESGVACRSACECTAPGQFIGEELALFDHGDGVLATPGRRTGFTDWYDAAMRDSAR